MATTQTRPYLANADIKLEYGAPQTFALKFAEGKSVESRFPGGRVMFTAIDDRKLFLDDEDANDLERTMRELGIGVADFMKVTKIRHARGGHSIRVERVSDADDTDSGKHPDTHPDTRHAARMRAEPSSRAAPSRMEAQLEKSVEMARTHGASAFRTPPPPPPPAEPASAAGSMSKLLTGALMASIRGYREAVELAKAQGVPCSIAPLEFTAEDIRQSATSMLIEYWRSGGTR